MQHRQVVRGEEAAAAAHRVLQLGLLADLDRAQPARLDHRQQLGAACSGRAAAQSSSRSPRVKKKSGESGQRGISASARAIAASKRPSFFSVKSVRSTRS